LDHVVAIPYDLFDSPTQFIDAWNSDPECVSIALAMEVPEREQYAAEVLDAFLVVMGSVSSGVASNALYDYIVARLSLKGGKTITYRTTRLPDGTEITEVIDARG
jgi:hypothetical protein